MPFKPVDQNIKIIVGPAIDDTDFKTREEAIAFNQAGMEVDVILEKYDGTIVTTAVTPTAAGDYDWAHTDQGYYELELPASGGASFNNTEEGIITIAVFCTGVLPFRSVSYDIIESQAYDALVKGTDVLQTDVTQWLGTAVTANIAGQPTVDVTRVGASSQSLIDLKDFVDSGYDPVNNGVLLAPAATSAQLVDDVWDEVLTGATHNIATSAGRRVREVGAYAIHSGTALAGNSVHITLAATASATDGIYNRNLLVLTGGTGVGQTRTIVDYDGATKIALIDREWRTNPDATTEYQITPDDTPLVVDHGIAQPGSTATTIKIRSYASAVDNTYLCNIVSIIAGTGRGQARLVGSYNGTTKVITICGDNWATTPDATSVYVMVPYGAACVGCINTDALAQINTECDTALSDVHLDDLIQLALTVNDAGPNATDFITSSAVAVDDWYNENMLLFTSGALTGLARVIDDYDGATKRIYLTEAFPQAPANGNQFVIVGIAGSTTTPATVADAVWDELEAGHTIAGSFGEEVTKQGKKLDRNFIWELIQQSK